MSRQRLPKLTQHVPEYPPVLFQVFEPVPGDNYYHVRIRDQQDEHGPEFIHRLPRKAAPRWTIYQVAVAGAAECAGGIGVIVVTRYRDGVPVFSGAWIGNGRFVLCCRSSDPAVADGTEFSRYRADGAAWLKNHGYQQTA